VVTPHARASTAAHSSSNSRHASSGTTRNSLRCCCAAATASRNVITAVRPRFLAYREDAAEKIAAPLLLEASAERAQFAAVALEFLNLLHILIEIHLQLEDAFLGFAFLPLNGVAKVVELAT